MKLRLKKRKIGEIYLILFTPYVFENNISGDCLHYILKNISEKRAISTEVCICKCKQLFWAVCNSLIH